MSIAARLRRSRPSPALRPSRSTTKRSDTCSHLLDEVRDVHDCQALLLQPADQLEQLPHVVVREAARRLVEHEHAAAECQRSRDFHELLRRRRQLADRRVDGNIRVAELIERRTRRAADRVAIHDAERARARPAAPARRQARCCPSRSGAARATAPDKSSPRPPCAPRAGLAARTARRSASSFPHLARWRRQESTSACSCPRRSARRARTLRRRAPRDRRRRAQRCRRTPCARRASRIVRLPRRSRAKAGLRLQPSGRDRDCSSSLTAGSFILSRVTSCTPVSIRFSTGRPCR